MHFEATDILIEELKAYTSNYTIDVSKDNHGHYISELVTIDSKNHICFDVYDNEIIVFYFTDHCHFEDYTSELHDGEENYIDRAKYFLKNLLENPIRHIEYYKGKTLSSEKYFFVYNDERDDECIGNTWFGLERFINPFGKKIMHSTTWQFDKSKGAFTTRQPKNPAPHAIAVIDFNEDCYIEIFNRHGVYTYEIMEIDFDDYFGMFYWAPAVDVLPTGMYDTREKAMAAAKKTLENRNKLREIK